MNDPITLVILDYHDGVRAALASSFRRHSDFALLGDTGDVNEAIWLCTLHQPRIALMDVRRLETGPETCLAIMQASPASRLVVQATFYFPDEQRRYLELGAAACLLKVEPFRELANRLKRLVPPS